MIDDIDKLLSKSKSIEKASLDTRKLEKSLIKSGIKERVAKG